MSVHIINNFLCNVAYGAHSDDNSVCIGCAVVVEELIVCAELFVDLAHIFFNDSGESIVIFVASLSVLEEDIAVFCRAAENGMFGVERTCAESRKRVLVYHGFEVVKIPCFYLLNFVRCSETVKEVEERYSALDC